ncbi:MAG TPA: DinB family protein [Bryobacteraceae bacterium]|nr:DinB family protein [Bryobacteraceae bacterium]
MTSAKDLQALYDYCYWANEKLLDVVAQLTPEQFTQSVGGSYGSVRNTLVHVLSAEWGWLDRCGGVKRGPALVATDYPTVTALVDRWRQVEAYVREFLSSLSDEDLSRIVTFSLGSGQKYANRLGDLMHHAAIHGIHHRGQVSLLLRSLDQVPGNFDILLYYGRNQTS